MATIAELDVLLKARTTTFNARMAVAGARLRKFGAVAGRVIKRMVKFGVVMLAAGAAIATIYVKKTITAMDATAKLADRLGTTTEALLGLRHAANIAGVGAAGFDKALTYMIKNIGMATMGTGTLYENIDELGLSLDKMIQQDPADTFKDMADKVKGMTTAADKAALAYTLFGRAGISLINVLNTGREGIEAMEKEAKRLGISFGRVDAAKIEEANDAMTRARAVFTGIWQTVTIQLAPVIESLAKSFTSYATSGEDMGVKVTKAFRKIARGAAYLKDLFQKLIRLKDLWVLGAVSIAEMTNPSAKFVADGLRAKMMYEDLYGETAVEKVDRFFKNVEEKTKKARKTLEEDAKKQAIQSKLAIRVKAYDAVVGDITKMTEEATKAVEQFGMTSSEKQIAALNELTKKAIETAHAVGDSWDTLLVKQIIKVGELETSIQKLGQLEQFATLEKSVESMTTGLEDQLKMFGKTETEIRNLKMDDMIQQAEQFKLIPEDQLKALREAVARAKDLNKALDEQTKFQEALAKREEMQKEFESEVQSQLQNSPVEQFKRYREQVEKWMKAGLGKGQGMALLEKKMADLMGKEPEKLKAGVFEDSRARWKNIQTRLLQKEDIPAKQLKEQEALRKAMENIRDNGLVVRGG